MTIPVGDTLFVDCLSFSTLFELVSLLVSRRFDSRSSSTLCTRRYRIMDLISCRSVRYRFVNPTTCRPSDVIAKLSKISGSKHCAAMARMVSSDFSSFSSTTFERNIRPNKRDVVGSLSWLQSNPDPCCCRRPRNVRGMRARL
jgi:hypothetical protein